MAPGWRAQLGIQTLVNRTDWRFEGFLAPFKNFISSLDLLSDLQCFVVAFLTTVTRESEACEAWAEGHLREGRRELMLERKLSRILRLLIHHLDQQLVVQETRVVHPHV